MTLRLSSEQPIGHPRQCGVHSLTERQLFARFIYYVQLGRIHQENMAFTTTCLEIALVANMLRQRE